MTDPVREQGFSFDVVMSTIKLRLAGSNENIAGIKNIAEVARKDEKLPKLLETLIILLRMIQGAADEPALDRTALGDLVKEFSGLISYVKTYTNDADSSVANYARWLMNTADAWLLNAQDYLAGPPDYVFADIKRDATRTLGSLLG